MTRVLMFWASLVVFAPAAHADDQKAADALISRGLELRRENRTLDAIQLFDKANLVSPSARSIGQLGLAESAIERWSDAEEHVSAALQFPQDVWVRKNRAALIQALVLVRAHIGQVALTGPSGAMIVISGKAAGILPLAKPVRVNAGPALITATAPGWKPFEMSVPVEAGKETQLRIVLEPVQLTPPPPPQTGTADPSRATAPRSAWRTWAGTSLLAVGGAAAAWGITWIVLDGHTANGSCSPGAPPGCVPVYSTRTTGLVLTGLGAAGAVAGGLLLYASNPRAEVGVALNPSSLLVAGRF